MTSLAGHCEHAPACLHPSQRHAACAALLSLMVRVLFHPAADEQELARL